MTVTSLSGFGQIEEGGGGSGEEVLLYGSSGHENWTEGLNEGGAVEKISTGLEMEITGPSDGSAQAGFSTVDQYDLSQYSTLSIKWEQIGTGGYGAGSNVHAYSNPGDSVDEADPEIASELNTFGPVEDTFDISDVTNSRHISVSAEDTHTTSQSHSHLMVEEVVLEV